MSAAISVDILEVGVERRALLVALMQLYLHDLSAIEEWDVDELGSFGEDDLDGCWTSARRHPFIFTVDGSLAGFAIVDEGSDETGRPDAVDMAEFFVLRRWRRRGVGREVFRQLLARFPGHWEVRPFPRYSPGEQFWRQVCHELAGDSLQTVTFGRNGQRFPMYTFTAS